MNTEAAFLEAILADPSDDTTWLVLADWLEEQGQLDRAELVRLQTRLRRETRWRDRAKPEKRVQELLTAGVRPCVPTITNSIGMVFALIPPGVFWMGSIRQQPDIVGHDERPRRRIEITRPFFLGIHHVTQGQYEQITNGNQSYFRPERPGAYSVRHIDPRMLPVDSVSYLDSSSFCRTLALLDEEKKAQRIYRLPTEAEWEYACRACICHSAYHFGLRLTRKEARFNGMGGAHPLPVGSYRPNLFGIHDMHGNLWEWCADWYDVGYYQTGPLLDPPGPDSGDRRVLRGGGWSTPMSLCRSALRGHNTPGARHNYNGFRVAISCTPRTK
jgi:uncharacterized protein (TIGR02996 family)